jgi:hypothetical protein
MPDSKIMSKIAGKRVTMELFSKFNPCSTV